jgi:hypothetical protein
MPTATVPNAGTYDLLVDVGFLVDGFTLDDPIKGLLDGTEYVLDGSTTFASVTEGVTNVNVRRGRKDPDDAFNAGSMTFVLNDTFADGVFNPFDDDPSNPYYDQALGVPGLAPGRAVQLIRYMPGLLQPNLVTNPSFEVNLTGWESTSANYPVTRITTQSFAGIASMQVAHNVTTAMSTTTGARIDNTSVFRIPVTPGVTYVASGYVKQLSGTRPIQMRARTFTTATTTTVAQSVISNTSSSGSWTKVTASITPTGTQVWMDVIFQTTGTGSIGDAFAVDAVTVNEFSTTAPEPLFTGFIATYDYQFTLGGLDTVTVFCVDNMYRLNVTFMEEHNPTAELTGARINAILDRSEVDYPGGSARNISTGTVELGGTGTYKITQGTNVKAYFDQITATAERGRIFVDREGVLVSQDRIGITIASPVVTFSDQGTGVPYNDLSIDFKADQIANYVAVTRPSGATQIAQDAPSQSKYFIKSISITDSLVSTNGAALDLANYLLEPEPEPRFTGCRTWFGSLTSGQRDDVAVLEIGDIVTIEKDILIGGVPTLRGESLAIEGIEHRIGFADGHIVQVYTSPTVLAFELLLDDPVYGRIDENNVLG